MDRSSLRRARHLLTAWVGLLLLGGAGLHCDSGAVGIEACREIESRKCEVLLGLDCPGVDISEESDVAECKLFYHDQCMFGIADATADPDGILVEACVTAIDQAAACQGVETIADCENAPEVRAANAGSTPCELILFPERLTDCSFLRPPEEGAGGSDGTGAGGSDGTGGSATGGIASGGSSAGGAGGTGGTATGGAGGS